MFGSLAERIYFTGKYPLSMDYRYRLIKDIKKAETDKIIILAGGSYGHLFQESDKSLFVNIQALPKLSQAEWAEFKKTAQSTAAGVRASKEEVSFVIISDSCSSAILRQKTADEVLNLANEMQVMWAGSNRRYEFPLGSLVYKLKVKGDCEKIHENMRFYSNTAKNMIPNYKTGNTINFGIAVLPEGHELRGLLPELTIEELRSAALSEIQEFMKAAQFYVDRNSKDLFIDCLKNNPVIFDKLLDGWDGREPFDVWRTHGMPKGSDRIKKPYIPFFLWDDSDTEIKEARLLFESGKNIFRIVMKKFYDWVSGKYPLFEDRSWRGIDREDAARDMIEYLNFKLGIKPN
jgi:hypothetical protein